MAAALGLEHAAGHREPMIEARLLERAHGRDERAGLRLGRAVDDLAHARVHERAHAHQTRLDGDIHRRVGQPIVAQRARRFAQHEHLGVRGGIDGADRLIERLRDDADRRRRARRRSALRRPPAPSRACSSAACMKFRGHSRAGLLGLGPQVAHIRGKTCRPGCRTPACTDRPSSSRNARNAGRSPSLDFEAGEHATEVGAVIPVVEQADVPAAAELLEKLRQRAGTLGELEAAQPLVADFGRVAADHVPHVQLGELVVGQVHGLVARGGRAAPPAPIRPAATASRSRRRCAPAARPLSR